MRAPFHPSKSDNEGNAVLDFRSIWWTFTAFQRAQWNKIKEVKKKETEMKNQICQTTGRLETIIIFVWARRPFFGVEMDILGESLQAEKYLRAGDAEEVLTGNTRFEEGGKVQGGGTFDLQNLGVWQEEKRFREEKIKQWWWKGGKLKKAEGAARKEWCTQVIQQKRWKDIPSSNALMLNINAALFVDISE